MPGKRDFKRKSGFRDSRLIIIAAEGEETEKQYFDGLKAYYENPRVHIKVMERFDSASDPERIIKILDNFRSDYKLRKGHDQLWLVVDVDRWGNRKLSSVSQECIQKHYRLAVSNPSFELWFLLHIRPISSYSHQELAELSENRKHGKRTRLEIELISLLGNYNKRRPNMDYFAPRVFTAIENARLADISPEDRWPNQIGTRVYLLVAEIVPSQDD